MAAFRSTMSVALAAMLLLCPVLCGPGDAVCSLNCHPDHDQWPCDAPSDPCKGPGDNCICQGAMPGPSAHVAKGALVSAPVLGTPPAQQSSLVGHPISFCFHCPPAARPGGKSVRILLQSFLS